MIKVPCACSGSTCFPLLPQRPAVRDIKSDCSTGHTIRRKMQLKSNYRAPRRASCAATASSSASDQQPAQGDTSPPTAVAERSPTAGKKGRAKLEFIESDLPNSRKQFTVTLPANVVKKYFDLAVNEFRETSQPSGFRKGSKVPDDILFRNIDGGIDTVKNAALEEMIQRYMPQVLEKYQDVVLSESLRIDTPSKELIAAFDVKQPLSFVISIDIAPVLTWKAPYSDIEIEVDAPNNEADTEVIIQNMLKQLQKDHGVMRIVEGRGLQRGDMSRISFNAFEADGGRQIEGAAQSFMNLDTETADEKYIPGLVAGMEGMVVGESRVIPIVFPDNWVPKELANLKANCEVTLKELFKTELAELNDTLVQKVFPNLGTVEKLKAELTEATQQQAASQLHQLVVDKLARAVGDLVDADLPEAMINNTGEQEFQAHLMRLTLEKKISPEMVGQLATPGLRDNYIKHNREHIEGLTRSTIGFESIFMEQNLQVSDQEVMEEVKRGADQFEVSGTEYDQDRLMEQALETCKGNVTLEYLEKSCNITVNPKP